MDNEQLTTDEQQHKLAPPTLPDRVKNIYETLESLSLEDRERVLASVIALLRPLESTLGSPNDNQPKTTQTRLDPAKTSPRGLKSDRELRENNDPISQRDY